MKARVKATDKVVEVKSRSFNSVRGGYILKYVDQNTGVTYFEEELFFPKDLADNLDYWTRLEHQAAIAAMQGILSNQDYCTLLIEEYNEGSFAEDVSRCASDFAHALVEKYKKEGK